MKFIFRTDASLHIGIGHVMRCLSLAEVLRSRGYLCVFICRNVVGHLAEIIKNKGFKVYLLDKIGSCKVKPEWLPVSSIIDAEQTNEILSHEFADCLIVDHYGLESGWQKLASKYVSKLFVIDDLANRMHICDLLLDQSYGRKIAEYRDLVPGSCELLCGSKYALLRPEFSKERQYSLERRSEGKLKNLLISLGGTDQKNFTDKVLKALCATKFSSDFKITVVMGPTAPHLESVKSRALKMPYKTDVKVNVDNMAELMATSDLAIGAAGATSWERCCLGLPTILLVLAKNQMNIAEDLNRLGAAFLVRDFKSLSIDINKYIEALISSPQLMLQTSKISSSLVDGKGLERVITKLTLELFGDAS